MISNNELQNLNHAARILERDGLYGYGKVVELFGENTAKTMTVMYLRCLNGSLEPGSAKVTVPQSAKQQLRDAGLFEDEIAEKQTVDRLKSAKAQAEEYMNIQMQDPNYQNRQVAAEIKANTYQRNTRRDKIRAKMLERKAQKEADAAKRASSQNGQVSEIKELFESLKESLPDNLKGGKK